MSPVVPDNGDTIFALASGAGRAAIAVVRISGPASDATLLSLAGRLPPQRRAALMRLRDPHNGNLLDEALVLRFEAGRSETGEAGAELHLHGSPAVVRAVLAVLGRQPGLRPAEPGEFARRAFANGRLDLAQLEGLADLIEADTEWQRRQAQRQLSGAMRDVTAPWRAALIDAAALAEAAIDFADEVDGETTLRKQLDGLLAPICDGLRRELDAYPAAERLRGGLVIVIAGPPNAGKSTLLNALVRREAAIISAVAGTTRDAIEVHLDLGGVAVTLVDTAGLRDTIDPVERIGIARAQSRIDDADLVLWLDPGGAPPPKNARSCWHLRSKVDQLASTLMPPKALPISARTGLNVDMLLGRLAAFASDMVAGAGSALLVRERHQQSFATALDALQVAQSPKLPIELIAEQLRTTRYALDRVIGAVDVEDVLGSIFSRFCIGK